MDKKITKKKSLDFGWESPQDRLWRFMKIPPFKKLERLYQMHQLVLRSSDKKMKAVRLKLRELR